MQTAYAKAIYQISYLFYAKFSWGFLMPVFPSPILISASISFLEACDYSNSAVGWLHFRSSTPRSTWIEKKEEEKKNNQLKAIKYQPCASWLVLKAVVRLQPSETQPFCLFLHRNIFSGAPPLMASNVNKVPTGGPPSANSQTPGLNVQSCKKRRGWLTWQIWLFCGETNAPRTKREKKGGGEKRKEEKSQAYATHVMGYPIDGLGGVSRHLHINVRSTNNGLGFLCQA